MINNMDNKLRMCIKRENETSEQREVRLLRDRLNKMKKAINLALATKYY
jgi:hypothetical protein